MSHSRCVGVEYTDVTTTTVDRNHHATMPGKQRKTELTSLTLITSLADPTNHEAWEEFHAFYWNLIRTWALAFGCPPDTVTDIYQNTAVAVLQRLPTFEHSGNPGAFRNWLKQIVRSRVEDYRRWENKHSNHSRRSGESSVFTWSSLASPPPAEGDPQAPPEAEMDRIWLHHLMELSLTAARERVTPEKFESFRRYVIYEEDADTICEDMDIRRGTLFQHKSSFLEILREEFVKRLEGLHDVGPLMRNAASARRELRRILKDYVQDREQLRDTLVLSEAPAQLQERLDTLRRRLRATPPPGKGDWLMVLSAGDTSWFELSRGITIGSSDDCDLRLAGDDVSAQHAAIICVDGTWVVRDNNSTNGVRRNGKHCRLPLTPAGPRLCRRRRSRAGPGRGLHRTRTGPARTRRREARAARDHPCHDRRIPLRQPRAPGHEHHLAHHRRPAHRRRRADRQAHGHRP